MLLAATLRTGEPATDLALARRDRPGRRRPSRVRPAPLSEAAVARARRATRLGAEPDAAFARRLPHATTGGNPLLAAPAARPRSRPTASRPDAAHADVVRAIGSRAVAATVAAPPGAAARRRRRGRARRGRARRRRRRCAASPRWPALGEDARRRRDRRPRARRDPAPRDAAGVRAPARARRRLPRAPARRARAPRTRAPPRAARRRGAPTEQVAAPPARAPPRGERVDRRPAARGRPRRACAAARRESAIAYLRRALDGAAARRAARPALLLELGARRGADQRARRRSATCARPTTRSTIRPLRVATAHVLGRTMLFAGDVAGGVAVASQAIADLPDGFDDVRTQLEALVLVVKLVRLGHRRDATAREPVLVLPRRTDARRTSARACWRWSPRWTSSTSTAGARVAAAIATRALEDGVLVARRQRAVLHRRDQLPRDGRSRRRRRLAACDACARGRPPPRLAVRGLLGAPVAGPRLHPARRPG